MSFSPLHNRFINFATQSYISPSSSIGALGLSNLQSNMEWCYHFANSQVLYTDVGNTVLSYSTFGTTTTVGTIVSLGTIGPFKINKDKGNLPQALFLSIMPYNIANSGDWSATVMITASIRTYDRNGDASPIETLTTTISSPTDYTWKTLSGSVLVLTSPRLSSYGTTGSAFLPYQLSNEYKLNCRSTNTSEIDSVQSVCICYVDFSYTLTSIAGTAPNTGTVALQGIYLREINSYEALS